MRAPTTIAKVTSTQDPENLGRVQVQLQGYEGTVLVWLRMLAPYASSSAGFVFLPEVDDEVLVLRGADDVVDAMYILGALYNGKNVPTYTNPDGENNTKTIRTRAGVDISISDEAGKESITIKTPAGTLLALQDASDKKGLAFGNSDSTVSLAMDTNGVSLTVANGKPTSVSSQGDVSVDGKANVEVKAAMQVTVQAGTNLVCKGSVNANLEAGAQLVVKGGAQVSVEAPLVKIQGGLVQIN